MQLWLCLTPTETTFPSIPFLSSLLNTYSLLHSAQHTHEKSIFPALQMHYVISNLSGRGHMLHTHKSHDRTWAVPSDRQQATYQCIATVIPRLCFLAPCLRLELVGFMKLWKPLDSAAIEGSVCLIACSVPADSGGIGSCRGARADASMGYAASVQWSLLGPSLDTWWSFGGDGERRSLYA